MPKGVKVAPPQQSKLEEMWGKKKKPKTTTEEGNDTSMEPTESMQSLGAQLMFL